MIPRSETRSVTLLKQHKDLAIPAPRNAREPGISSANRGKAACQTLLRLAEIEPLVGDFAVLCSSRYSTQKNRRKEFNSFVLLKLPMQKASIYFLQH
jgi:hypothetical protein